MCSRRANYTDRHCVLRTVCSSIVSLYETRLSITRTSKRSTPTFGAAVRPERDVHTSGLRASGTRDPSASRHSAKPKSDEWWRTRKKTAISYLDCRNSHNKTPRDSEIYDSHCTVVCMSTMRCLKVANFSLISANFIWLIRKARLLLHNCKLSYLIGCLSDVVQVNSYSQSTASTNCHFSVNLCIGYNIPRQNIVTVTKHNLNRVKYVWWDR